MPVGAHQKCVKALIGVLPNYMLFFQDLGGKHNKLDISIWTTIFN